MNTKAASSLALIAAWVLTHFASEASAWQTRIRGSGTDFATNEAYSVVTDSNNDVIATGVLTDASGSSQFTMIKLSGIDGRELWRQSLPRGGASALALDQFNNVVAGGSIPGPDGILGFAVLKFSGADGTELWRQVILGPDGLGGAVNAVAVDGAGDVVAAGFIQDHRFYLNYTAIKFSGTTGAEIWRQLVHGGSDRRGVDQAFAVTLGATGNGASAGTIDTASDSVSRFTVVSTSEPVWTRFIQGTDLDPRDLPDNSACAVMLDFRGDVIAAGVLTNIDTGVDIALVKFSGADGTELWRRVVDGNAHGDDNAWVAAIDPGGFSVTVSGKLRNITGTEYTVLKFAGSNGDELWRHVIDDGPALSVAMDRAGNVLTAGNFSSVIKLSTAGGVELWRRLVNDNGTGGIAVDLRDDVVVAGNTFNTTFTSSDDFTVTKLSGFDGSDF